MNKQLASFIIVSHILAGFLALSTGLVPMVAKKGGKVHRLFGKLYAAAMVFTCVSALVLAGIESNGMLFSIGIFSLYMVFTGYRSVFHKRPDKGQGSNVFDWLAAIAMALVGGYMVFDGLFAKDDLSITINPVLLVFGLISLSMGVADMRKFSKAFVVQRDKYKWLFSHFTRMMGAYIATFTAFAVTNLTYYIPDLLAWLAPTVVGTTVIFLFVGHYRKKFSR